MSKAGKEAQGYFREKGARDFDAYKAWGDRSNQFADQGDQIRSQTVPYWQNRMNTGIGTVQGVRNTGREVMPGVDEALARRQQRLQDVKGWYGDTSGNINQRLTDMGAGIGKNYDALQGEINDTTGRLFTNENNANTDTNANIRATYGDLARDANAAYGGFRDTNRNVYTGLQNQANQTFDTANKTLEMMRPGSEFQVAQTARSYAPVIASAAGNLRRAGIDPSSPQAANIMRGAQVARARGMDDAAAAGTNSYVNAKNNLALTQQANRESLGLGQMDNEIGLGREQSGITRGYGETGAGLLRDEIQRHNAAGSNIDLNRMNLTNANRDLGFQRGQDWQNQNIDAGLRDWQTRANIEGALSDEELTALGLQNQQFDRGMGFTQANQQSGDVAAQQMGNIGAQDYNNAFNAANAARGYGQDASQNYGTTYQLESANAGWGKKLLGGALGAAAPMLNAIPGVGPFLSIGASALGGAMSGQPQQQQGGGWGGAMPQVANTVSGWFNPSMASAQANMPQQSAYQKNAWMWNPWAENPQAA